MQPDGGDPAQAVFEPTGELCKDYCAYCETEGREEREDIMDGITIQEDGDTPYTNLFIRGLENPLIHKDVSPLKNAILHCSNLHKVQFYSCSLTLDSWKLLVEAAYRAPALLSFAVDFNGVLTTKDPSVSKKSKGEYYLQPQHAKGGINQKIDQAASAKGKGGKPVDKKKETNDQQEGQTPIRIPDSWNGIFLCNIQEISLRANCISDKQVELIASSLETSTELVSLSLWGNAITDEGASLLAKSLRGNCRLTSLNISNNRLTDDGLKSLIGCLEEVDLSISDATALRQNVGLFHDVISGTDPPTYPTYQEIFQLQEFAKGGSEKKPPPKGKGKAESTGQRPTAPFDKHVVKISDSEIRVPGNKTLWSLNVSGNRGITADGVASAVEFFNRAVYTPGNDITFAFAPSQPPPPTNGISDPKKDKRKSIDVDVQIVVAPLPSAAGSALKRLVVSSLAIPQTLINSLDESIVAIHSPREIEKTESSEPLAA